MDDAAPPQDANPSMMNDYGKPDSMPAEEGDGAPLDDGGASADGGAAPTAASMDPVSAEGGGNDSMMNDNAEEGGLPSGSVAGAGGGGGGNLYLRPIFLGNLSHSCMASDVENVFQNPAPTGGMDNGEVKANIPVDRVDMKRGYCFVFLKDPTSLEEKERAETYVQEINGMYVPTFFIRCLHC